jgi:endonuclease/exonuclease/phosphatase family metal-dependent hydrolase
MAAVIEPTANSGPGSLRSMHGLVVASFNVHGGVDGFGRPFDVVGACRELDADVLVLQETWSPPSGVALAAQVGDALGYKVEELALTRARLSSPPDDAPAAPTWGPVVAAQRGPHGLHVGELRPGHPGRRWRTGSVEEGAWGIAVLSRVPVSATATLDLGQLPRDPARRGAITVDVDVEGRPLRVIGTHLSHLSHGSIVQLRALHRLVTVPGAAAVLAGDMNMWGPPLSALMPGWTRAVRGRTWPSWRPLAQLDHILITDAVTVDGGGEVVRLWGSDHLPVRARLRLR